MTWNPPRDPNYGRPPAHPRIPVLAIFLTLVLTRPELSPPVTRRVLENQSLRDEMARHSAEDYAATAYLRAQLKDAVAGVKRMEKEAIEKDVAFEERLVSHEKAAASRERELIEDRDAKVTAAEATVAEYERKFEAVREFKEDYEKVEARLNAKSEECEELRRRLDQKAADGERRLIAERVELTREWERRFEDLKRSMEASVEDRYDSGVKRILEQNRRMVAELKLHSEVSAESEARARTVAQENRRLRRELDLRREMEGLFAKRGMKQKEQVVESREKMRDLERSMSDMASKYGAEIEFARAEAREVKASAVDDAARTRRLLRARSDELREIKALAKEAVRQRGELERFMISSLDLVKREMEAERARAGAGARAGSRPAVGGSEEAVAGDVDVAGMSWAERERVLRLAFARMNASSRPDSDNARGGFAMDGAVAEATPPAMI